MRRCRPCDVLWTGLPMSRCWCCGAEGEAAWLPPMSLTNQAPDVAVRGDGIEPPTGRV